MNRLKELRKEKKLNQEDFAAILGMSQTGYSKYEVGTNDIPTKILKKSALYFNTSIDYILGLTDNPKPYERSTKG